MKFAVLLFDSSDFGPEDEKTLKTVIKVVFGEKPGKKQPEELQKSAHSMKIGVPTQVLDLNKNPLFLDKLAEKLAKNAMDSVVANEKSVPYHEVKVKGADCSKALSKPEKALFDKIAGAILSPTSVLCHAIMDDNSIMRQLIELGDGLRDVTGCMGIEQGRCVVWGRRMVIGPHSTAEEVAAIEEVCIKESQAFCRQFNVEWPVRVTKFHLDKRTLNMFYAVEFIKK